MESKNINEEALKIWRPFVSETPSLLIKRHIDLNKKLLDVYQAGESYYFIFNFRNMAIDIMSDEVLAITGYLPSEISVPFYFERLHPEDQSWFLTFEKKIMDFFIQLPREKLLKYKSRYDVRFKKKDGNYIRILHQAILAEHDQDGKGFKTFVLHTDITHLKQSGIPVLSFIGLDGEPSYLDVGSKNIYAQTMDVLTAREKEILLLLAEGKASKEIAASLNISKLTVDQHRKNMLQKHGFKNTVELIGKAIRMGWI